MNEQSYVSEALSREIARYLAAVDLFRAEHCEPQWVPEPTAHHDFEESLRARAGQVPATH
jgi:hypothetical protein